jgi:dipeptidyl-peptidase-4
MSLMCLARAPATFRAAVAGAPVTSWDGYDTHYTERYMGTPQGNPDGYRRSSVMTHAMAIRGSLMLVHGMLDENVHFRHTARLVSALNRAGKRHDLLMLPDERHMPREEAGRVYVEDRLRAFFEEALR